MKFDLRPVPVTDDVAGGREMHEKPLFRSCLSAMFGILLTAAMAVILLVAGLSPQARAESAAVPLLGRGHYPPVNAIGGNHSKEAFVINSPSWSRDFQHVRTVNVDGNTVGLAAACKRKQRFCKIVQRVVANDGW